MTKIFVSYRSDDEPFGATFIDRELSQRFGLEVVFRDSRSIRLGDDFVDKILPAVREAEALLAVIGPRWLAATDSTGRARLSDPNDWVRREITEAFEHGVRVIPILLNAELPGEADLPPEIEQLARCQFLRFDHRNAEYDTQRLVDELTELIPGLATAKQVAGFEQRYIDFVVQDNSTFELFQVTPGRAPVGYSFDRFYVVPPITRRQTGDTEAELTGTGTDAANALTEATRMLLLGGAGAGKTTFLTWATYTVATEYARNGPWRSVVPFLISLRHFAEHDLPKPEQLLDITAPVLADSEPDHWISHLFESGRAMLLVDGLDELVTKRRDVAKRWIENFVRTYPNARYIISTRPSAVDDNWFVDTPNRTGLIRFELLPLSRVGLGRIVARWYEAALSQESDPAQRKWLETCRTGLLARLGSRPDLRTLVSSPLLAALLCWLYRQNDQYLPRTRRELLKQALDWLLVRWDETKPSRDPARHGVVVEDELRMTMNEKLIVLERFAVNMVGESQLLVSRDWAEERLERAMSGLRSAKLDAARVLQHLIERSGLLREHHVDQKVEFVHRLFRDYLASTEMVKTGQFESIANYAKDSSSYELVFLAAAQAREKEVGRLLELLLRKANDERPHSRDMADRLVLLAAACLGYADVVDPDVMRVRVQKAAERLIPPASFDDAETLAKAGRFVIDLLPGPADLRGPDQAAKAARIIRTLAMVGGEAAAEEIRPFADMHQSTVIDELLRAWRQFDFDDEYARTLLSHVDFGDRVLEVRRWTMLPRLRLLPTLRALKIIGDVSLDDARAGQHPLADIAELRSIQITANEVIRNLQPLAQCRRLRTVRITGYSKLRDLSALADSTVEELVLHPMVRNSHGWVADLASLAGAPLRSLSIQHPMLRDGLGLIPADLPLVELTINNREAGRSLVGIERWQGLAKVTANGLPRDDEVDALAQLPNLRHVVFHTSGSINGLARLRRLPDTVKVIELYGVPESDIDVVTTTLGDRPRTELRVHA